MSLSRAMPLLIVGLVCLLARLLWTDLETAQRRQQDIFDVKRADRLSPTVPRANRRKVAVVELVGVEETIVILRDAAGEVLYRSDPFTNATLIAKDVDWPVVTLRLTDESHVIEKRPRHDAVKPPSEPPFPPRRLEANPKGCERSLSTLVNHDEPVQTLCVTQILRAKS